MKNLKGNVRLICFKGNLENWNWSTHVETTMNIQSGVRASRTCKTLETALLNI